jgi:hypothetical protein
MNTRVGAFMENMNVHIPSAISKPNTHHGAWERGISKLVNSPTKQKKHKNAQKGLCRLSQAS